MAASLSSVLTIGMSLDGSTVGDASLVLTLGYGIGEAVVVVDTGYFRPLVGPSKEIYVLIGKPRGLDSLTGPDETIYTIEGP